MKHILEIDLATASYPVGVALLKFCTDNKLSYSLHGGEAVAPRMLPPEKPAAPALKRKAKPAKKAKAAAKKKPAKRAKSAMEQAMHSLPDWKAKRSKAPPPRDGAEDDEETPPEERDRTIEVSAEERAKVESILRDLDKGEGVMTEAVYAAWGGKDRHKQAVLYSLRVKGEIRDNGKVKRALRLFAPGVEHPTTGQTLTRKPRVRVRDAKTKAPKREIVFDPAAHGSAE